MPCPQSEGKADQADGKTQNAVGSLKPNFPTNFKNIAIEQGNSGPVVI
jgi:uncharacterized protein YjbJ (UPF0337 family)